MREISLLSGGRRTLGQKCTDNPYRWGNSKVLTLEYEASVDSCCRQSVSSAASDTRVILFDTNPGALTNTTERNAYIDKYDAQDYTECPCICKYEPSKSSRRRQWWGDSGRRRLSGVRSDEEAAAVAAQANCPFAADHEDTQATTQISSSSDTVSSKVPKPAPTPAPTPAPAIKVSGVWVIAMENASKLWKNAEGLAAFKKALKKVIVQLLDMGLIKEHHIQIDIAQSSGNSRRLSSNSTKGLEATYTITVPKGAEATTVATKINSKSTDDLQTSVNSALIETAKTVPDIEGLTSSRVLIIAKGALSASTFAPEASVSGRATAHGAVIVSVSLLAAMTSLMTIK